MAASAFSTTSARRVLIRGVNWLGDAVMTTPALQRLRAGLPGAHLSLLTPAKLADLWQYHPSLDAVLSFVPGESAWSVARRLRREGFDTALVLPNSPRSALEVWLASIPQRVGYARPWRNWFLSQKVPARPVPRRMRKRSVGEIKQLVAAGAGVAHSAPEPAPPRSSAAVSPHQVYDYLQLAAALGASPEPLPPLLVVRPEEMEAAREKFGVGKAAAERLLLGLNPGAAYGPAKRWPVERFIAAALEVSRQTGCAWLLFGGAEDGPLAARLETALAESRVAAINVAGRTSLRELMALLRLCRVLLTNDSGPMHVAAALGTPVVVPFGSTAPELTGPGLPGEPNPYLLRSGAPCSPCFRRICPIDFRCMTGIPVEQVVEALLHARGGGGQPLPQGKMTPQARGPG